MTFFDLFVLAIVGASVAAGALRGFVRALIASVGLVVGFFVASHTYQQAGAFLRGVAVCSVVYLALTAFPVKLEAVARARTGPALAEGARLLALCTSDEVRARFLAGYQHLFARTSGAREGIYRPLK